MMDKINVTVQEAFREVGYTPADIVFNELPRFVNKLRDEVAAKYPNGSLRLKFELVDAAIFAAGRIQGIREERQRRKGGDRA